MARPVRAVPIAKRVWLTVLNKTDRIQWRDRAGFSPASLFREDLDNIGRRALLCQRGRRAWVLRRRGFAVAFSRFGDAGFFFLDGFIARFVVSSLIVLAAFAASATAR